MAPGVDPGWHQLSVVASLDLLAPVTHTHRGGEAISQSPPSPYSPWQELPCASSSSILQLGLCLCPKRQNVMTLLAPSSLYIYVYMDINVLVPVPELVRQREDLKPGFKPLFKLGCSSVCLWSPFPWPQPLQACWQYHVSILLNVSDLKLPVQHPNLVMRLIDALWAALACNTIKFQEIENIPVRLVGL